MKRKKKKKKKIRESPSGISQATLLVTPEGSDREGRATASIAADLSQISSVASRVRCTRTIGYGHEKTDEILVLTFVNSKTY